MAQLQHPGIVVVHDIGREENRCFIVTEYLEGQTLQVPSEGRPSGWFKSVELVSHIASVLGHAHSRGIMHRDIKPSNIMMTADGRCVLMDFGLAVNDLETTRGQVAGTPSYMSPEQIRGESHRIDGRTDIFALGVVLYLLLAGRYPFRSEDRQELFRRIVEDAPQLIRQLNPAVPDSIEIICRKALSKNLEDRYTTAYDFAEALQQAAAAKGHIALTEPIRISPNRVPVDGSALTASHTPVVTLQDESSGSNRLKDAQLRLVTLISFGFDLSAARRDPEKQHAIGKILSSTIGALAETHGGVGMTDPGATPWR